MEEKRGKTNTHRKAFFSRFFDRGQAFVLTDGRFALFARFGDWIPIRVSRKK